MTSSSFSLQSRITFFLMWLLFNVPVATAEDMTYIYHPPESNLDNRYEYQWEILRTALETTRDKYGSFKMIQSEIMTEPRQEEELAKPNGDLTIMYLDYTAKRAEKLHYIPIPVDMGLVGYRIFLINKKDRSVFSSIHTIGQLKQLTIGQGLGWLDADLLRSDGFQVMTGTSYEGLFSMLKYGRFDGFLRGANEIIDELNVRRDLYPEMEIEDTLLIHYPLPMLFWFSDSPQGLKLAKRVEEGMRIMLKNGTYKAIFNKHYANKIKSLKLSKRRVFELKNPFFDKALANDETLWFKP